MAKLSENGLKYDITGVFGEELETQINNKYEEMKKLL
jgi:hypothetical protein